MNSSSQNTDSSMAITNLSDDFSTYASEVHRLRNEVSRLHDRKLARALQLALLHPQNASLRNLLHLTLQAFIASAQEDKLESELDSISEELEVKNVLLTKCEKAQSDVLERLIAELRARDSSSVKELTKLREENETFRLAKESSDTRADQLQSDFDRVSKEVEKKAELLKTQEMSRRMTEHLARVTEDYCGSVEKLVDGLNADILIYQYDIDDLTERFKTSESRCRTFEAELALRKRQEAEREAQAKEEARRKAVEESFRRKEETDRVRMKSKGIYEDQTWIRKEKERERQAEEMKARTEAERKEKEAEQEMLEKLAKAEEGVTKVAGSWEPHTSTETARCQKHDEAPVDYTLADGRPSGSSTPWTVSQALAHFQATLKRFENPRFYMSEPLTVKNVPWPRLGHPDDEFDVQFAACAVEPFFQAIEKCMDHAEYRILVVKALHAFNPSNWRLLLTATVQDQGVVESLRAAGRTVHDAINVVWKRCRADSQC